MGLLKAMLSYLAGSDKTAKKTSHSVGHQQTVMVTSVCTVDANLSTSTCKLLCKQ